MSETKIASEVNIKEKEQGSQWAWVPGILFKPRSTCKKNRQQRYCRLAYPFANSVCAGHPGYHRICSYQTL